MKSKSINPLVKLRKIIALSLTFFKIYQSVRLLLAKYPLKNYSLSLTRDLVLRLQKISNILEKATRGWSVNNPVAPANKVTGNKVSGMDTTSQTDEKVAVQPGTKLKSNPVKKSIKKPKVELKTSEKSSNKSKKAATKPTTSINSPDLTTKN